MRVNLVNSCSCKGLAAMSTPAKINRALLKPVTANLKPLAGPEEKSKAKGWVALYTMGNASIAAMMAQAPGADEAALAGVEVVMAAHIFNGIYKFDLSKSMLRSLAAGVAGHAVGKTTFKLASKSLTWIPGVGNFLNAAVSAGTTGALGAALIAMAEDMDAARKRGQDIDDFIKKMKQ